MALRSANPNSHRDPDINCNSYCYCYCYCYSNPHADDYAMCRKMCTNAKATPDSAAAPVTYAYENKTHCSIRACPP
jgi:hypothetical protein